MQVAVVERVSTAAKGLCMWLHAMNVYHKVAKEVGPKREKVAQLTAQLEAANKELQAKRDNLAAVVAKVEQLQKTCDETVAEKQRLLDAQAQTALTRRLFPKFSELQLWEDGVSTISRHLDAVFMITRESTGLVSEPRPCRDAVDPRRRCGSRTRKSSPVDYSLKVSGGKKI